MFFIAYHIVNLVIFAVGIVFAWITVSKLRKTSATYNARLLPFAYYSLTAWILSVFQYLIVIAGPFIFFPSDFFQNTSLWLAVVQNALWVSAVLSLYSKQFSRISLTLPSLIAFSIVIASVGYRTTVLASEPFVLIDAVSAAVIFAAFAYSIVQLRLSKTSAAAFLIHGLTQWIWGYLWFTPFAKIGFPLWRIVLLFVWIRLIPAILQRAQNSYQAVVRGIERVELPNPQDTFGVMISSTIKDLEQERDAADRAIRRLRLTRFRAETYGSRPHSPLRTCASMAKGCNIFILIIGERYGSIIESGGISVVEFEYNVARAQNPEKILVYVKDGPRESRLEKFLEDVQDFTRGYFTSLFATPEELYEQIQRDVMRWLTSHAKQQKSQEDQANSPSVTDFQP
jgi:hypothetical protein